MFILGFLIAAAIVGPLCYFLGLRRRAPEGETLGGTAQIMLSGPSTRPPAR
jgi:hypothetical protein